MGRAGIGRKMQLEDMLEEDKMVLSKLLCKMSSEVLVGKQKPSFETIHKSGGFHNSSDFTARFRRPQ